MQSLIFYATILNETMESHFLKYMEPYLLSTQMALLRPSADISYVGTQKDIYGLKVA